MNNDRAVIEIDDLPPNVRECRRATRENDRTHFRQCADCLDDEVRSILMDAASHRQDGNELDALALEAEAEQLRARAARLRRKSSDS